MIRKVPISVVCLLAYTVVIARHLLLSLKNKQKTSLTLFSIILHILNI